MAQTNRTLGRIQIGYGLISATIVMIVIALSLLVAFRELGVRVVIVVLAVASIGVLWTVAARNGQVEREYRTRLKAEHPGALVERVNLWSLPNGRVEPGTPMHFLVADASEISFETITQTVLLRIPVTELGFIGLVTAQGDRVKDKALTLIYGDDQSTVQLFTITYSANDRLGSRLRTAIGWPPADAP